jgi:hypothetical protein
MNIKQRIKSPTPPFFKKVTKIGLTIAAIGTALLTAPVALPVVLVKIAGYLTVAGGVASAVSQTTCLKDDTVGEHNEH